jgi:transcriptional regulator with XRE-family HTH domain
MFAARLRFERDRLGYTAERVAKIGGVTRGTQFGYEAGLRRPDADYLLAILDAGFDVMYLLTGVSSGGAVPPTSDDQALLIALAKLPKSVRRVLLADTANASATVTQSADLHSHSNALPSPDESHARSGGLIAALRSAITTALRRYS